MKKEEFEILKEKIENKTATKDEEFLYYKELNVFTGNLNKILDDYLIKIKQ